MNFPVLRQFTFSSALRRNVGDQWIDEEKKVKRKNYALCKIKITCTPSVIRAVPVDFQRIVNSYTQKGLSLIAVARRDLDPDKK
ncbi:unnamed protein product, partial [Mesorhabditis belari]|uniref:Uncharacterized protein n=1 Tax=Mesorhabditis belari TaxID=2138241 RepID=A0AAF3EPS1_9BILA